MELLGRDSGVEVRLALQALLRRIGECRMGMAPVVIMNSGGPMSPVSVSGPTSPTSPTGLSFQSHGHTAAYGGFDSRR